ncbi:hypothetical protein [Enterococcus sp. BWR-S5]|uniref:hypothetical protein n=1 Tax=Enterococcus sp. BWR-S5 TaxID=2787714 RepID=UPI0019245CBA|nr:hypothetical protein [Enterococcus sp. BWR-S5]MBL1227572.1 hypothetical protein [Enterococcus sp. BWR-S5]
MNQLFDETYNSYRTIWYGYYEQIGQPDLIKDIKQMIEQDQEKSEAEQAICTSWVFYCKATQGDALQEQVRASIMIRFFEHHYNVHCNMSDFEFVTQFDAIESWKNELEALLNNNIIREE